MSVRLDGRMGGWVDKGVGRRLDKDQWRNEWVNNRSARKRMEECSEEINTKLDGLMEE